MVTNFITTQLETAIGRISKHRLTLPEKRIVLVSFKFKYFIMLPVELRSKPPNSRVSLKLKDILFNNVLVVYNKVGFINILCSLYIMYS